MKVVKYIFGLAVLALAFGMSGCSKGERTVGGALIGAGTGAAIGGAAGGGKGAAIGAGVGAVTGAIIGRTTARDRDDYDDYED